MAKNRIRELRKERGLTQVELAEMIGCYAKLETGESELNTKWMEKLSVALNVKPYELLPLEWLPQPITKEEEQILALFRKKEQTTPTSPSDKTNLYKSSKTKVG